MTAGNRIRYVIVICEKKVTKNEHCKNRPTEIGIWHYKQIWQCEQIPQYEQISQYEKITLKDTTKQ